MTSFVSKLHVHPSRVLLPATSSVSWNCNWLPASLLFHCVILLSRQPTLHCWESKYFQRVIDLHLSQTKSVFLKKFDKQQPTFLVYFQTVAACCLGDVAKSLKLERQHDLSDHLERTKSYQDLTKTTAWIFLVSEKHMEYSEMKNLHAGSFLKESVNLNVDSDSMLIQIKSKSKYFRISVTYNLLTLGVQNIGIV